MGNQHSFNIENYDFPRSTSMGFMQHIPTEPMNKHRIGKVYIMVHKTRQQQMGNVDLTYAEEKRAHHSILIDIAGASNAMELHGVWFHLTADVKTRETDFRAFSQPVPRSSLVRYSRPEPGRLHPPDNVSNPREWAALLKSQAEHVYNVLTNFESLKWSGTVNCQQYVRQLTQSLGLTIGADLHLAGDVLPIIVDVSIFIIGKQSMKEEEENQANADPIADSNRNSD